MQVKSKNYELAFIIVALIMALLFSENEVFWGKKSWRNSYFFYLLEFCALGIWVYSFSLQIIHLLKKYLEIIRRRDHSDDETIPAYGITSGLQRNSIDGIITMSGILKEKKIEVGDKSGQKMSQDTDEKNSEGEFKSGHKGSNKSIDNLPANQTPSYSIRSKTNLFREREM